MKIIDGMVARATDSADRMVPDLDTAHYVHETIVKFSMFVRTDDTHILDKGGWVSHNGIDRWRRT